MYIFPIYSMYNEKNNKYITRSLNQYLHWILKENYFDTSDQNFLTRGAFKKKMINTLNTEMTDMTIQMIINTFGCNLISLVHCLRMMSLPLTDQLIPVDCRKHPT